MISSISIERFRRFDVFGLENLGRINLIMGANNCGKTTALEAIHLLTSQASREALAQAIWRRDGAVIPFRRLNQGAYKGNVWPLFYGNDCELDATFELSSRGLNSEACLTARIGDRLLDGRDVLQGVDYEDSDMALYLEGVPEPLVTVIPIDSSGNATKKSLDWTSRRQRKYLQDNPKNISLTSAALDAFDLVSMWNDIVLTPDEEQILRVLASLDDGIDRVAAQFSSEHQQDIGRSHAGFVVKHKGIPNLLPLQSFGSGVWRLFSLAVVIAYCRNGTLLIDEIDSGLDLATQSIMWRMLLSEAQESDVQIFATTHNIECVNTLAEEACRVSVDSNESPCVVFHRIEEEKKEPVQLSPNQVRIADKHSLEVR